MVSINRRGGLFARLDELFVDREFFMRANGQVKFLTLSATVQRRVAFSILAVIAVWLVVTLAMSVNQLTVNRDRAAIAAKQAAVASSESRIDRYRRSVDDVAADLSARQDALEGIAETFVAEVEDEGAVAEENARVEDTKISAAIPEAAALVAVERRQIALAGRLTRAATLRAERAESAIRRYGLNPVAIAGLADRNDAMGGPLIPVAGTSHPSLQKLTAALRRMDAMERTLLSIPSAAPANISAMTSGYGYRRDPFTGGGAMHNGIDFRGPHGAAVLAAANGRVTFSGWKSGYGKTVEITHGNGLMTRYAHLSRVGAATGSRVVQGTRIGAMGSTGRSTGTHLHFEVRVNGAAVNPKPFLEAKSDVLKITADARKRARLPVATARAPRG